MALIDIVSVDISLQTQAVTSAGFGNILFISNDQRFPERVRSYTSLTAMTTDGFATTDNAYIAAQAAFSQSPSPQRIKIGRRGNVTTTFTPENVAENTVYNVTVTVNDGDSVTATYTALITDTAEEIATDLAADINGDANVAAHVTASVNGVGASAVLEIVANVPSTDIYFITDEENLSLSYVSTETGADSLTAISEEDNDFYFIATDDHTTAYVTAMAAAVEARTNIYFVSSQDADDYGVSGEPPTDTFGLLAESNYFRTSAWFHHQSDTLFPEVAAIALVSPSTPGTKVWANTPVAGFGASRNAVGNKLTDTQTTNLDNKFANYFVDLGGVTVASTGKVSGNEFLDVIRDRDYMVARIRESMQNLLINSPKIPYTESGISRVKSTLRSVLDRMVTTSTQPNILQENNPYVDNFPLRSEVPLADIQNRILNASFTAFLAGAISAVKITGTLTYDAMA